MKKIIALLIVVIFSINIPVYAEAKGKIGKHYKAVYESVKKKLDLTDYDIERARSNGKTAFDLAKEAGISDKELREYIINEAEQSVESAVKKKMMPISLAKHIKKKVRNSITDWDGYFKQ